MASKRNRFTTDTLGNHRRRDVTTVLPQTQSQAKAPEQAFKDTERTQGTLDTLVAERDAAEALVESLNRQIETIRSQRRQAAIDEARRLVEVHGLGAVDVFQQGAKGTTKGGKVAPKYRNPTTGELWSGRGRAPRWYAIAEDKGALLIHKH